MAEPPPPESHKIRAFRHHLIAYVLVIALLIAINLAVGRPYWVVWVALGWGAGILAHAFCALRGRARPNYRASRR